MVVISERSVEQILDDVAPKLQKLTGWDPRLDSLQVKIVDRNQLYRYGRQATYEALGIRFENAQEGDSKPWQTVSSYLILGQYEPFSRTMLIVPENLRFTTNKSALAVLLGHELLHRCQFEHNPELLQTYGNLLRESFHAPKDSEETKQIADKKQCLMTLIEGDASFVEDQLKEMYYQNARLGIPLLNGVIGLRLVVSDLNSGSNGVIKKARQYINGKSFVSSLYQQGGRAAVNGFYQQDVDSQIQTMKKWC